MNELSGVAEGNAEASTTLSFLGGGGETGNLIRSFDWSRTALGPIESWPQSLRTATAMLLASPVPIVMLWGEDGFMIYNDAYSVFAGGRHPQLLGSKVREGWPEVADFNDNVMKVGLAGGTLSYKDQELTLHRHGKPEQVWMNLDYSPVLDESGEPAGVIAIVIETTERVVAEQDLRESEGRYRTLFNSMDEGFCIIEFFDGPHGALSDYVHVAANPAYTEHAGIPDVVGQKVREMVPDEADGWVEFYRKVLVTGEPVHFERELVATRRHLELSAFRIEPASRRQVAVLFQDVTARKAAERALRDESNRLEVLNRTGADLSRELDLKTVVQMVTDAGVELSGAEFGAFFYNVHDDKGESYLLYSLSGAEPSQFDFGMPRNTEVFGPTFGGEGTIRSDDITKDPRYGRNAPHKGMPTGHLPVCSYLAVPVVSRSGEVIGGLFFGHHKPARFTETHEQLVAGIAAQAAIAIDNARLYQAVQRANETLEHRVDERTAELETANEALRQAQKMEAIGQLTGGIAHDFNNMLTVIRGSADVLQRRDLGTDKRQRYLQAIAETSDRAARLTSQLLAFARRQALKPEVFNAAGRVVAITDMLGTVLGGRIKLDIANLCDDCFVEADAAQFETALLNMAVNARDAMDGEGDLKISIGQSATLDGAPASASERGYVTVAVTDSGHGIALKDLDRIFEPFFTTKETGKGTGLGLSQVYGFAKQSGGEVSVASKPGHGTTFTLYLPRATGADLGPEKNRGEARHDPRDGRVLVVEDNDEVGRFAEQVLADLGYQTRRASNAVEALALLDNGGQFDIVFSDIVMPGQSGIDLAHSIRKRWPSLPIVLTSGYSDALAMRPDDNFPLLHKPYSLDALSAALSEALKH